MTNYIFYPGGTHGNFLIYLLNYMTYGDERESASTVYDNRIDWKDFEPSCKPKEFAKLIKVGKTIKITVDKSDYLQYLFCLFTRAEADSGINFDLDTLHINTVQKASNHMMFRNFIKSIKECCNFINGNTTRAEIREWIRILWFENNTIDIILEVYRTTPADYELKFSDFYKADMNIICSEILETCNIKYKNKNVQHLVDTFRKQVTYIENLWDKPNIITQAYLDSKLKTKYSVQDIDLLEQYFTNEEEFRIYYKRKENV